MKSKISKIWRLGLSLVLVSMLAITFVPTVAADPGEIDCAEWTEIDGPSLEEDANVGPMCMTSTGVIFKAVEYYDEDEDDWFWKVMRSEDGYDWDDTEFDLAPNYPSEDEWIDAICCSTNYENDETFYVGTSADEPEDQATVYRCRRAGDAEPVALIPIIDSYGDEAENIFDLDCMYDGDDNWLLASCDNDIFALRDKPTPGMWIDMELATDGEWCLALCARWAPDYDDSSMMWAVVQADIDDTTGELVTDDDDYAVVTSTIAPGQWGQVIGNAFLWINEGMDEELEIDEDGFADMAFKDDYTSDVEDSVPEVIVAVGNDSGYEGNLHLVEGVPAPEESLATPLWPCGIGNGVDMRSVDVRGESGEAVIIAGANNPADAVGEWDEEDCGNLIYLSSDSGDSWESILKQPTGEERCRVLMAPGPFDLEEGVAYCGTWGEESAICTSVDGGLSWNGTGNIDTTIDEILDLALHPDFCNTPKMFMLTYSDEHDTYSLWRTLNGNDEEPDWERVLCAYQTGDEEDSPTPGNLNGIIWLVEIAWDDSAVYIHGEDADGDRCIWKSTDNGLLWGSKRAVKSDARIYDWQVPERTDIYAATGEGFMKSLNSGLSWRTTDTCTESLNSIDLAPGFEENDYLAVGSMNGGAYISDSAGDDFGDRHGPAELAPLTGGRVWVIFDSQFAEEDADGEWLIYLGNDDVDDPYVVGEIDDTDIEDVECLEDDAEEDCFYAATSGMCVSPNDTFYAMSGLGEVMVDSWVEVSGSFLMEGTESTSLGIGWLYDAELFNIVEGTGCLTCGDFMDGEVAHIESTALTARPGTWYPTDNYTEGYITIVGDNSGAKGTVEFADNVSIISGPGFNWGEIVVPPMSPMWWTSDLIIDVRTDIDPVGAGETVARLLLHEDDSLWQWEDPLMDDDIAGAQGLWCATCDDNTFMWTAVGDELWSFKDTLSVPVELVYPDCGAALETSYEATLEWEELDCAEEYTINYENGVSEDVVVDNGDNTRETVSPLDPGETYDWKVRVTDPLLSRWSEDCSFTTALGEPQWSPPLISPECGSIDIPLSPTFNWGQAKNATGYRLVIADNYDFTSPIVDMVLPTTAYQYTEEFEYLSTYYWKVQAQRNTDAVSAWSDTFVFTTMAEPQPPTPPIEVEEVTPEIVVEIPAPVQITPAYIWAVIGIGAALVIVVIVLIVRTRRVV
jgi:hypothetical protein